MWLWKMEKSPSNRAGKEGFLEEAAKLKPDRGAGVRESGGFPGKK